jgi:hypothetical protein
MVLEAAAKVRARAFQDIKRVLPVSDLIGLVCATFASLAAGVLVAHGVCVAFFSLFRARHAPAPRREALHNTVAVTVEG